MNMKLLSGLAVVLAMTSAMTFLGIYAKSVQKVVVPVATPTYRESATGIVTVPPSSGLVSTSVHAGPAGSVETSVTVKK